MRRLPILMALALLEAGYSSAQLRWTVPITCTDGSDSQTLRIGIDPGGTDGFDSGLDEFAPPAPPAGAFDARLRVLDPAEDYFTDVRSNSLTLKTFRVLYQAGSGAGPIVLKWDPSGLPLLGDFTIADNITGALFTIDMTGGDSLATASSVYLSSGLRILMLPMDPVPPGIPSLIAPADGAAEQATTLTLSWNRPAGAKSFQLQVGTDPGFGTPVMNDSTLTDTSRAVTGLSNNTTYFWRVRAKNPHGVSAYSPSRSFTTAVTDAEEGSNLRGGFLLRQNYPNPFNPTTVVRYYLPMACSVRLAVHDLLGREVAVLASDRRGPGEHAVTFDASGLAGGTYAVTLTADGFVQSKKILLVR